MADKEFVSQHDLKTCFLMEFNASEDAETMNYPAQAVGVSNRVTGLLDCFFMSKNPGIQYKTVSVPAQLVLFEFFAYIELRLIGSLIPAFYIIDECLVHHLITAGSGIIAGKIPVACMIWNCNM